MIADKKIQKIKTNFAVYISMTIAFAFVMLGGSGDDIKLTDAVMSRVKR